MILVIKPAMTLKDLKAMEAARREFKNAQGNTLVEAITTMHEKQKAYRAFGEKFFNNYPQS
jgi:hypothetical protein